MPACPDSSGSCWLSIYHFERRVKPDRRSHNALTVYPNVEETPDRPSDLLARTAVAWRVSKKLPVRDCQRVPHPRDGGF